MSYLTFWKGNRKTHSFRQKVLKVKKIIKCSTLINQKWFNFIIRFQLIIKFKWLWLFFASKLVLDSIALLFLCWTVNQDFIRPIWHSVTCSVVYRGLWETTWKTICWILWGRLCVHANKLDRFVQQWAVQASNSIYIVIWSYKDCHFYFYFFYYLFLPDHFVSVL